MWKYLYCTVKQPIKPPYERPTKVLWWRKKYFTIQRDVKEDTVSTDWMKPAYEWADEIAPSNTDVSMDQIESVLKKKKNKFLCLITSWCDRDYSGFPANLIHCNSTFSTQSS